MTITARYASRCATCAQPIHVGEQIEWNKGSPSRHTTCPAQSATPVLAARKPRAVRRSGGKWTGCSCGSIEEYPRPTDCASCRFDHFDC